MAETPIKIFQIYYNDESRGKLDPLFTPLDNSKPERPDWYEFWVIRNFLKTQVIDENAWYGFLSPSFQEKTGLTGDFVNDCITRLKPPIDVALFSPHLDWLTFYNSVFEQGEAAHPGLIVKSQQFINYVGLNINLSTLVTDLRTGVFSNYVVARPRYWRSWLSLADKLVEFAELEARASEEGINSLTSYKSGVLPMKVFIQERLPSIVILTRKFLTYVPPHFENFSIYAVSDQRILVALDMLKRDFMATGDEIFMRAFWAMRQRPRGVVPS